MPLNLKKCKIVEYGKGDLNAKKLAASPEIPQLQIVETERDLGVEFDSKLNFKQHIKTIVSKANFALNRILRVFKHLDSNKFLILYKSFVRPILEFSSPVWSPQTKCQSYLIEKIQKGLLNLLGA